LKKKNNLSLIDIYIISVT